ncbi:alpha-galactosidase [Companilactobacillus huachuanensis]|uniref:Alpha-galactosidase n=1 Tax=Companilactobacillus huachuanensis TaxID=2559914 RepID=A0ABW1RN54_9LACO|nr:alpha-galactosidase [Companilactobacillus huachuanensis]
MTDLIQVDQKRRIFYLSNQKISYIFRVMPRMNKLEHIYFGDKISSHRTIENTIQTSFAWGEKRIVGDDNSSLSKLMQEYPEYGTSDYRMPAFEIDYPTGDSISNFEYVGYKIIDGALEIKNLPHVRYKNDECQTLIISLKDQYSDLELSLNYTIDLNNASIIKNATIKNNGKKIYNLENIKSNCLDIPNEQFELITLNGNWAREKHVNRESIHQGIKEISSSRGASGHVHDPFIALVNPETTQSSGVAYGISTIYSGNHKETVELDSYGVVRILTGINDEHFKWELKAGESFTTPQSILTFSSNGLNQMSQTFHNLIRDHLIEFKWKDVKPPVLINNWEATYFDFNESKIIDLATKAATLGCDLFVLDDGWFAQRNGEKGSLGDWRVNFDKLPHGLDFISQKIHALGMDFGLWFEPEAVSDDTPIFKEHPEWIIGVKNKSYSLGRNEYLLDFSNPKVIDNIFGQMDKILSSTKIEYLKWDMNRNITEPYSNYLNSDQQGEFFHRYILGVYDLYERLLKKYPKLLIESCASGGGRFDLGMLYYAPQTWGSDDTDAYERHQIQAGESYVYPLRSIGTHVSVSPNHQTGRITSLQSRGNVALFGTFGYEMNLLDLSSEEQAEVKRQIKLKKKYDELITHGNFYRLNTRLEGTDAWMVTSVNQKQALVCYFKGLSHPNMGYDQVRLDGLDTKTKYTINDSYDLYGDELMKIGLPVRFSSQKTKKSDFESSLFEIKAN